jgi:hypothetical protein
MPLAISDLAIVAARRRTHRPALLLPRAHLVWKRIRRRHMVQLCRRLVVPRPPRLAAVHAHHRALVAHQQHNLRVRGIHPHILVVVAARSSPETHPRLAAVFRLAGHNAGRIHHVRIGRVRHRDRQITAANLHRRTSIVGDLSPALARVVRPVETQPASARIWPFVLRRQRRIQPPRLALRHRHVNLHQVRRQPLLQLRPRCAPIGRLEQPTMGALIAVLVLPRSQPRIPHRRIHHLRIGRIEHHVRPARVLVLVQHLGPALAAILRAEDSPLRIRPIRMPQNRRKQPVRIGRINRQRRNLLPIAQSQMHPRRPRIGRAVNSIAYRKIRPMQPLAARNIDDVVVRGRHRDRPNRLGVLAIEDRLPRPPVVVRLPHPAVHLPDVKDVRLVRHTRRRPRPSPAKRPNHPPPHLRQPRRSIGRRCRRHSSRARAPRRQGLRRGSILVRCPRHSLSIHSPGSRCLRRRISVRHPRRKTSRRWNQRRRHSQQRNRSAPTQPKSRHSPFCLTIDLGGK